MALVNAMTDIFTQMEQMTFVFRSAVMYVKPRFSETLLSKLVFVSLYF